MPKSLIDINISPLVLFKARIFHLIQKRAVGCVTKVPFKRGEVTFYVFWPCISIHLCNKNQLDALFMLSLFLSSTSTRFGHICSPSSGSIRCIYTYIYTTTTTCCAFQLTVFWPGWDGTHPSQVGFLLHRGEVIFRFIVRPTSRATLVRQ